MTEKNNSPLRRSANPLGDRPRPRLEFRPAPRRTDGGDEGATGMAKGQKRSNKEAKKPKADKKKVLATAGTVAGAVTKPKAGADKK